MSQKNIHRTIAFIVFIIAAATYFMTAQPSVSFWDCGEFVASSYGLQVPHPPGTPRPSTRSRYRLRPLPQYP